MTLCGSYTTVKFVRIDDFRLGTLRLLLLSAIVGYVIFIEMAQLGGYLESDPVEGVVEFSLKEPTHDNCDPYKEEGCTNAFQSLNELKYCEQADANARNSTGDYSGSVYPCQIYESVNAEVVRETSLIVWTRATTYNQTLVCDGLSESESTTCPRTYKNQDSSPHRPFYIAQSEAYTVLIEHSVTASKICEDHGLSDSQSDHHYACSAQASHYQGRLYSRNEGLCGKEFLNNNSYDDLRGPILQSSAPCFIGPNRTTKGQDFFSIDVLLQAVGVSLDDCTDGNSYSTDCITYRESGATLLINVVWNDFRPFEGLVEPFYYYSPKLIGNHYREMLPFYHSYRASRTLMRAHGIKIAVLLSGDFHQFQFVSFLITFTTAMALLAVARKVVDVLMLHVVPEKGQYQQIKFETLQRDDLEDGRDEDVLNDNINVLPVVNYGSSYDKSVKR